MLLSDVIQKYKEAGVTLLRPSEETVIRPSRLVLFLCDLISIIKRAHKMTAPDQVTSTLTQMCACRDAAAIPDLVEKYDENAAYDCLSKEKFTLSHSEKVNYVFESV